MIFYVIVLIVLIQLNFLEIVIVVHLKNYDVLIVIYIFIQLKY